MSNAQKWIAGFLLLFLILFFLEQLTKPENKGENAAMMAQGTVNTAQTTDGIKLLENIGCTSCHGADLSGTKLAPALTSVKNNWSRDELLNFLRNPDAYQKNSRFKKYKQEFKTIMPAYSNIDVKTLGKIVDYLMSLKKD